MQSLPIFRGVVRVRYAPTAQPTGATVARFRILAMTQTLGAITRVFGYAPGAQLGLGGPQPRRLITEWAYVARRGEYLRSPFDAEAVLAACSRPVLAITLAEDGLAPQAAVEYNLSRIGSREIERFLWRPDRPLSHNRWPRRPDGAVARVLTWLQQRGAGAG